MKNSSFFNASFTLILTLMLLLLFAPATMAEEASDHYAVEVISSENLGDGVLGDDDAVIGEPATWCLSADFPGFPGGPFRVKLVEAPWNTDLEGNPVLAQIQDGGHITVKFDGKVQNNPDNPYGIDFIIYSNTFFTGAGYVDDDTDMNNYIITGGGFNDAEPGIVSVSQDGETWYTFDDGPYSKGSLFPTQAFQWDADNAEWTDEKMDFTKAVNPALTTDDFYDKSAAEAIALYDGAGGGTGFDLNDLDVQLDWIQYVKVEALGNKTEVDAFAAVSFLEEETDEAINIDLRATGIADDIFNVEDLEVPAGEVTVGDFTLDQHTAIGVLAYYCQENDINLVITEGDWGLYVYQIGDNESDENSWMYYVDGSSPWLGADQYDLSEGESVHFVNFNLSLYSLSMSIEPESIAPGDTVTVTVLYTDGDGEEVPAEGAEIYYTDELDDFGSPVAGTLLEGVNTDAKGKASFTWEDEGTYYFYAQWQGKSSQYQWPVATLVCIDEPDPEPEPEPDDPDLENPVLYWQNTETGLRYLWFMDGLDVTDTGGIGTFGAGVWNIVGVGDLDGDGKTDIVWHNTQSGLLYAWMMDGLTILADGGIGIVENLDWKATAVGDMNGNGSSDIIWENTANGRRLVWFMDGVDNVGQEFLAEQPDPAWSIVAAADMNGNGQTDLILQNADEGLREVWLMNGLVREQKVSFAEGVGPEWQIAAAGDLNRNGHNDIVWEDHDTGLRYVWFMEGFEDVGGGGLGTISDMNWQIAGLR